MLSLHDPHSFLGLHRDEKKSLIRLYRPGAEQIYLEVLGEIVEALREEKEDVFVFSTPQKIGPLDYRVYHQGPRLFHDPYAFLPSIGEMDLFLFNQGCHYELYSVLGAIVKEIGGIRGTQFAIWAPNAKAVYLVGDFNGWDGRVQPMRTLGVSGIWALFVPEITAGEKYKFEIETREGYRRIKSDPMAFFSELRPLTASIVFDLNSYSWSEQEAVWKTCKEKRDLHCPMTIYEVHLASWRDYGSAFPNYRELAKDLASYCLEMGFTHVELLPIMEHPLDISWGYQVTGFFSVTSRYGTPADFQFFVDFLHQMGIGVILDWVPAHFPTDDHALNRFDGTALYEHEDPRQGMHPHWHTAIFNYGRKEVSNFLIANALFWLDKMHVDGLRVDAVASMVYLDYGRKEGEWIPNSDGSNYNVYAIEFLKHLNAAVHERFPGALMIAEESSSYRGVTHPLKDDGLGFDLKWNMGWMNDTLRYFSKDPIYRKFHQNDLTFSLLYAFSERFILSLSHDETVHGKGSLLTKMPGPDWQKFANLRLLYSYMICHPGKKLLFMGCEIGSWNEWNSEGKLDWFLLQYPLHGQLKKMIQELNHFYLRQPPLWKLDFDWSGYEWIDFSDAERSTLIYLRKSGSAHLVCVHNFTPEVYFDYWIQLKNIKTITQVFNTDAAIYGGSDQTNGAIEYNKEAFRILLAPLATMIFEVEFGSH
jgi:1,4-alpha-glucan branching enzyme